MLETQKLSIDYILSRIHAFFSKKKNDCSYQRDYLNESTQITIIVFTMTRNQHFSNIVSRYQT